MQEILRVGPHTANVSHRGDGCRIIGAVLYGNTGISLPVFSVPKHRRPPCPSARLHGSGIARHVREVLRRMIVRGIL